MQGRFILPAFVVALLSLPVLGYVQYRWIERVSVTELQREKARLTANLSRVEAAFDAEITRAQFWFGARPRPSDETPGDPHEALREQLQERLREWNSRVQFPSMVSAVLLSDDDDRVLRIASDGSVKEDPAAKALLESSRAQTDAPAPAGPERGALILPFDGTYLLRIRGGGRFGGPPRRHDDFEEHGDEPRAGPGRGGFPPHFGDRGRDQHRGPPPERFNRGPEHERYVVLNREVLQNELLLALLTRYFGAGGYDTELRSGSTVLSRTGIARGEPDAATGIFAVRPDCLFGSDGDRGGGFDGRPMGGFDGRRRPPFFGGSNVLRRAPTEGSCQPLSPNAQEAVWILRAWHPAGSVAAAVAGFRTRNLTISFGVLACLGGALIALWVSTQRAAALAQRQIEFAMSVSHELRTPLTVMRLAGDNLAEGVATKPEQVRRYGETIRSEAERLGSMVEQILMLARVARPDFTVRPDPINPAEIAEASLRSTEPLLRDAGFTTEKEIAADLPNVCADRNLLVSALNNVLVNAVRYAADSKWVRMRVVSDGVSVDFEIADRGKGISSREQHKVFRPFYRGGTSTGITGTGLGLHLVKRIVQAHGGTVRLDSSPGAGTVVTISLPVDKTQPAPELAA